MQDGAPPHFSCFVTDVLNERFPDAWIGRGGPIPWLSRSPDLSPLDFFLWGYIKNIVYGEKIRNIQRFTFSQYLLHVHVSNTRTYLQEDSCNKNL